MSEVLSGTFGSGVWKGVRFNCWSLGPKSERGHLGPLYGWVHLGSRSDLGHFGPTSWWGLGPVGCFGVRDPTGDTGI